MLTVGPSPSRRRRVVVWDVVLSVLALTLAGLVMAAGVAEAVLVVAALHRCPTCSSSGALVSVGGPVVVALAAGFAGLALTALRLVDRRACWPFALATLLVCAVAVAVGGIAAVGVPGF